MPIKRVKAASLLITIVITLILAILSVSLITLFFYRRAIERKGEIESRLINNLNSATALILADTTFYDSVVTDVKDLFGEGNDSIVVTKKQWGCYQVGSASSTCGRYTKSQSFFYGTQLPDTLQGCLYLADHQRPCLLAGASRLTGNAFVPVAGLKPGTVDGKDYQSEHLIDGSLKVSQSILPLLNAKLILLAKNLLSVCADPLQSNKMRHNIDDDSLMVSFRHNPLFIFLKRGAVLRDCFLSGQVIVFADSNLIVYPSAHLTNVMLVAPSVTIKQGCNGSMQIFANDSLVIEDECSMNYPTSLFLQKSSRDRVQNYLKIGRNCQVSGQVISLCTQNDIYKSSIEIGERSIIHGLVYTMGYLDLKGEVQGTVMTDYFIHHSLAAVYENILVDAIIDRKKLSPYFEFSILFPASVKRNIIQWVN
jgi:hypothetical protein